MFNLYLLIHFTVFSTLFKQSVLQHNQPTNPKMTVFSKLITYRKPFTDEELEALPHYKMSGGPGVFSPTIRVPKFSSPQQNSWEHLLINLYNKVEVLFEEGNMHGNQRFAKTLQVLSGQALIKYRSVINDPNGPYMPNVAANRTDALWAQSIQDLTSALYNKTYLGNDIQEVTNHFSFYSCKTDSAQKYPDSFALQEARMDEFDLMATERSHFDGNPLDDTGKNRRTWKRLPEDYKNYITLIRGVDPFDQANPLSRDGLIEMLDQMHLVEEKKANKKRMNDNSWGNRSNKRPRPNGGNNNNSHDNSRNSHNGRFKNGNGGRPGGNKNGNDSRGVSNRAPTEDYHYVNFADKSCKWKNHPLNPKSDQWDYELAKDYMFRGNKFNCGKLDGGKCKWYRDIFNEGVQQEKAKRQNNNRQQNHGQRNIQRNGQQSYHQMPLPPPPPYYPPPAPYAQGYHFQAPPSSHPNNIHPQQGGPSNQAPTSYQYHPQHGAPYGGPAHGRSTNAPPSGPSYGRY